MLAFYTQMIRMLFFTVMPFLNNSCNFSSVSTHLYNCVWWKLRSTPSGGDERLATLEKL